MVVLTKEEEGLRVITEGINPAFDVVLIHGLQGHPKGTWLYRKDSKASEKSRLKIFKRKLEPRSDDATEFFWPVDALAKDYPDLRIAAYGYDSRVSHFFTGPADKTTIVGHGRSLLNELETSRRSAPFRPIIFIVHSLGGLVLKEALRKMFYAQTYESEWRAIYDSIRAVLFLGTPHHGSNFADWGKLAQNIVAAAGIDTSDSMLKDLQVDASLLDSLRDDFSKILREESFWVFTFMEQKGFKGVTGLNDKIVPDTSATLGHAREIKDYIAANHMDMCRFVGAAERDNGYRKVKAAIEKSLNGSPSAAVRGEPALNIGWKAGLKELLGNLKENSDFSQRYEQVEVAYGESFAWLFTNKGLGFKDWLSGDNGLYWIRGLPATGKSTLMKMAYDNPQTNLILQAGSEGRISIRAQFFFHDRGSQAQKTLNGLLCGIVYQILDKEPQIIRLLWSKFHDLVLRARSETQRSAPPTTTELSLMVELLLSQSTLSLDICLFVDALDEYSSSMKEIADFLKTIVLKPTKETLSTRCKVCFSSRPNNDLLDQFESLKVPGFDIKDHTTEDIRIVVDTMTEHNHRFQHVERDGSDSEKAQALELKETVCSRAEGVFLWVRLMLNDVLQEFTDGRELNQLHTLLMTVPVDLETFYLKRIIARIPSQYRNDTLRILDTVRCSLRPLWASEFYTIYLNAHKTELRSLTIPAENSTEPASTLDRLLRSRTGGLVEVRRSAKVKIGARRRGQGQVQFVHQTVKSWAAKIETRSQISTSLANNSTGFEYFTKYCVCRLNSSPSSSELWNGQGSADFEDLGEIFLKHIAIQEQSGGTSQKQLLRQLHDKGISSLYQSYRWIDVRHPPIMNLISLAVATEMVEFLAELVVERMPSQETLDTAVSLSFEISEQFILMNSEPTKRMKILSILLERGASVDGDGGDPKPFRQLILRGYPDDAIILRKFLEHGQNPNVKMPYRDEMKNRRLPKRWATPLHFVSANANVKYLQVLLCHNAAVNALDSMRQTPLNMVTWRLGNQVVSYLRGESSQIPSRHRMGLDYDPSNLQDQFNCISILLKHGAKLAANPDVSDAKNSLYFEDDSIELTQAHINSLVEEGFNVDSRILKLPRMNEGFMGRILAAPKWLMG